MLFVVPKLNVCLVLRDCVVVLCLKIFQVAKILSLDYVCKFKMPMIISTGMHSIKTVKKITKHLKKKD